MFLSEHYNPNKIFHPGVTLQETLDSFEMSQIDLALRTGLTPKTINEIIQEKNPITPETAIKFASVFGTSANFWNNLQRNYEADLIRLEENKKLSDETIHLNRFSICYTELIKIGCVKNTRDKKEKVKSLLNFFSVSSLSLVPNIQVAAFRQSKHENVNKESLAAWLRCGELVAQKIETLGFDRALLQSSIPKLRSLTREEDSKKLNIELEKICTGFGVALVVVPYFKNTHVNGAAWWVNQDKPIIQLSFKGHCIDSFWFTFFHEVGHLLKHGKKEQFIDYKKSGNDHGLELENEADKFANDTLIPQGQYDDFIGKKDFRPSSIDRFATEVGVSPSIVAGRICYTYRKSKKIWKILSPLRKRYVISV
ncbi:MAG TPA: addiction module antidote protein, HigA family [Candidatus Magasanikbacteria bacterium]|uniref:Plasmid maintenance system antidote protein, XRE family n=2 Tax=Candidatus Magasanikiibacteriota TaxID=1752731 RepID=A0A0G0ZZN4_9BACT|nr:MAG: Plasmid maintenance system antidote protein, XRE family [Candidatus Magasanikbacteria bacterium GW2011_GWC2_41_17]KKS54215.1 MAG: Plasmid maintenance system antidote protein, XRE family [Candidatus Magasanikbacteria bacterium GW2011_GWA2_42_32]HBV57785.1 addiction module antidote protein, HigA family [Candidatus Magasanikbacteria bacterium]HBX16145.1 addiction module antidote protein, HigA family [Candidatus Magasanikbacteria bacterium]